LTAEEPADPHDFSDIPLPQAVTDAVTLEDMLAEGELLRKRGVRFVALPPTIGELPGLQRLLGEMEGAAEEKQIAVIFEAARRLFRVHDPEQGALRVADRAELERCWTMAGLAKAIQELLKRSGLGGPSGAGGAGADSPNA
jgi:hypothetical protein